MTRECKILHVKLAFDYNNDYKTRYCSSYIIVRLSIY